MATVRQRFLARLAEQERRLAAEYDLLAGQVMAAIVAATDPRTGKVDPLKQNQLQQQITGIILAFYIAMPMMTALRTRVDGRVEPISPFMQILWQTMRDSAQLAAEQHANFLRKRFADQPELLAQLQRARLSFVSNEALTAASERGAEFLADFAPPHLYPRSDGKVLEERIRMAAVDHSTKTTGLVRELLVEGATLTVIAATLRRFFKPDELLPRGGLYGTTGVNRAMAIARSEPVFAFGLTQRIGAIFNPFVKYAVVRRSSEGAKACPICDPMVGTYPADDYPVPGFHPRCVCRVDFVTSNDVQRARNRMVGSGAINVRGPLNTGFVDEVMGQSL